MNELKYFLINLNVFVIFYLVGTSSAFKKYTQPNLNVILHKIIISSLYIISLYLK